MKIYQIVRMKNNVVVTIHSSVRPYYLRHKRRHSPTGFEFGYGGSGPADLALSILWDYLREEPSPALYQQFKWDFIAPMKVDCFTIDSSQIDGWLDSIKNG